MASMDRARRAKAHELEVADETVARATAEIRRLEAKRLETKRGYDDQADRAIAGQRGPASRARVEARCEVSRDAERPRRRLRLSFLDARRERKPTLA
mmetsp:Transcript_7380/g.21820  ORF Transcript_7380/g.21820 Transcript_7380/m.21820 type:complete len:97 (+) Transcript_7380:517-807(+)